MKNRLLKCLLLIVLFNLIFSARSIASDPWPTKSSFGSIEYTGLGGFNTATLNYEMIWHKARLHHGFSAGLTMVVWDSYGWSKIGTSARYTIMTGKSNSHLELNAGVSIHPKMIFGVDRSADGESSSFTPIGHLGYRYQKPDGKGYFRIFAGIPGIGIGAGIRLGTK